MRRIGTQIASTVRHTMHVCCKETPCTASICDYACTHWWQAVKAACSVGHEYRLRPGSALLLMGLHAWQQLSGAGSADALGSHCCSLFSMCCSTACTGRSWCKASSSSRTEQQPTRARRCRQPCAGERAALCKGAEVSHTPVHTAGIKLSPQQHSQSQCPVLGGLLRCALQQHATGRCGLPVQLGAQAQLQHTAASHGGGSSVRVCACSAVNALSNGA